METAYVGLGSNLGDREATLADAVRALDRAAAVRTLRVSSLYETDPVGPPPQGPYLNAALAIETALAPRDLLGLLQAIEVRAGRVREGRLRWSARTLDLDVLLHGSRVIDDADLQVPHPHLVERAFVLEPLCEIAASVAHPTARASIDELAARVRDTAAVRRFASETWQSFAAEVSAGARGSEQVETGAGEEQPAEPDEKDGEKDGGRDGDRGSQHRAGR